MIGAAFDMTAPNNAERPTPPNPQIPIDCPSLTCAEFLTAPMPVSNAHPKRAAISNGISDGSFTRER